MQANLSAIALRCVDTLSYVSATKGLEAAYRDHLARVMREILDRDFGGVQRAAAARIGINQSQISQILRGSSGGRSAGIVVLVRLREYTKRSIDDLLGLDPLGPGGSAPPAPKDARTVEDRVAALERALMDLARPSRTR